MPPSTKNSAPTLGVDKKCLLDKYSMFYKIEISLNMWFKRHELCKSMKKKKIYGHMKVLEEKRKKNRDTWRSQGIEKKDEHMQAHKKKKKEMIAMSQNKKIERDHSYKRSIV